MTIKNMRINIDTDKSYPPNLVKSNWMILYQNPSNRLGVKIKRDGSFHYRGVSTARRAASGLANVLGMPFSVYIIPAEHFHSIMRDFKSDIRKGVAVRIIKTTATCGGFIERPVTAKQVRDLSRSCHTYARLR